MTTLRARWLCLHLVCAVVAAAHGIHDSSNYSTAAVGHHPMVRAWQRVQDRAAPILARNLGAADSHTASPLPLFERLKQEHDDGGEHDRHNPQEYQRPLARRRAQTASTTLTEDNTEPLRIEVDFSALFPTAGTAPPSSLSTCFHVGHWFRWNFPKSSVPPCQEAKQWEANPTWDKWVQTDQDSCHPKVGGGDSPNVYSPSNRDGEMCNRKYDSSAQNCCECCLCGFLPYRAIRLQLCLNCTSSIFLWFCAATQTLRLS